MGPQQGKEWVDSADGRLPPQIDRLRSIIGKRKIDFLLVSIGGNDAGFVPVIHDLVEHDSHLFADDVQDISARVDQRLTHLREDFRALSAAIAGLPVRPAHVLLTEYPDPFYAKNADILPHDILEDAADSNLEWLGINWNIATASLSPSEMGDARRIFIHPLNQLLNEVVRENGWRIIPLQDTFKGHGYSDDSESGVRWTWVATFKDSVDREGTIDGTLHPNARGHTAMAAAISNEIARALDIQKR